MKILALESSAVACSAALCEDEKLIAQSYQNNGLTHSVTLMPMATSLLANCGVGLEEVDVIAVAAGPGSFTGLRIGVAAAKGLAWPGNKPCAPCSTLESMAWGLAHTGLEICAVMDARRQQVYNARFRGVGDGLERLAPDRAIGLDEVTPWSHMDYGITHEYLVREYKKALAAQTTPPCNRACSGCGANRLLGGPCFDYSADLV